jgi:Uma2 family endonuclease
MLFNRPMVLRYNPLSCLPSAEDLPDSDDTPVDNELQDLIPHLLKVILAFIWSERFDWFFGIDMGNNSFSTSWSKSLNCRRCLARICSDGCAKQIANSSGR